MQLFLFSFSKIPSPFRHAVKCNSLCDWHLQKSSSAFGVTIAGVNGHIVIDNAGGYMFLPAFGYDGDDKTNAFSVRPLKI